MKRVRDHDPERLELSDPALKRALTALGDDGPSAAELQRMRQRLMGVFDAPPPSRGPGLSLVRSPFVAFLVGVGIAAVMGLVRHQRDHQAADTSSVEAPRDAASDAAPASGDSVEPQPQPAPVELEAVEPAPNPHAGAAAHAAEHIVAAKPRRVRALASHAARASEPAPLAAHGGEASDAANGGKAQAETPAVAPAATLAQRAPIATVEESSNSEVSTRTHAEEAARRPAAPAALDEASLLQRARQLAASDAAGALRLLNEHKQRFAHGMLTPEREVLAIQLLRSLSRRDEAARRLRDFRRNFPDSVYLQRLEP